MKRRLGIVLVLIIQFSILGSCDLSEHADLGNKLTIFEGDKPEDRVIVYCTGYSFGYCKAGIYIIPTYEEHYDKTGKYAEYVTTAKSDEKWVIAKTVQIDNNQERYWIIDKGFNIKDVDCQTLNCDSILQSYVIGRLDSQTFAEKVQELDISLRL